MAKAAGARCPRCGAEVQDTEACTKCLLDVAAGNAPADEADDRSWLDALGDDDGASQTYELLEEIARGGMGVVYRARHRKLNRVVALKMILPHQLHSSAALQRFRAEAQAVAALDHPSILPIYEVGELDGLPFFSMKLARGGSLAEQSADWRERPREAAELIARVARAVHHAHERGILHRDLKPGNILLGENAEPYVTDFGIAKWLDRQSALTVDISSLGTPHYIAPEQAGGEKQKLGPAADVYSLGAILYELLTGRPPFSGDTPVETLRLVIDAQPPAPRSLNSQIPRNLELICLKCLEKEPEARYPSAAALADDLERWLANREVAARPVTALHRGWRWTKRNPALATFFGAVIVVLLLLGIGLRSRFVAPSASSGSRVLEKSIAILPFENLNQDANTAYFAQGVQDEILTRLSKIADLKVISRTSTQHYKSAPENLPEIAKQLGVAHVLEGSVQKSADAVRINVQLIKAATDSHVWADSFDRKATDIFSVETEVARTIADQLKVHLTTQEEQVIAARPTDNPDAYDTYLRGLAYSLRTANTPANALGAQKYLREAVRLDPKFALAWAVLSDVDARGYITQALQPTDALREEARQAAETALSLQPNLGEAILAKGMYHYSCLKDYDAAVRYFDEARQFLPNSSLIPASLASVSRRRGQWDQSESYFKEAERLDPRNGRLLSSHAGSYIMLRRFPEALRMLDRVLDITPDDVGTIVQKAGIAQAEGDLATAAALLGPLHPNADDPIALQTQVYQAILERHPEQVIPRLKEILAKPDPALGFYQGELRFHLGWAQEIANDKRAAEQSWRQALSELEAFLNKQPDNYHLLGDLALVQMGLGDKAAALTLAERAMAVIPVEQDPMDGPWPIEIFARVAAGVGEPDRAIAALEKLLAMPYEGPLATTVVPLTPARLRLDPMFDPLRNNPRFQALAATGVASPARPDSIAVLPFENRSRGNDAGYVAQGIQDEILTRLGKISNLKVVSLTSAQQLGTATGNLPEVAARFGVNNVLEGSVQQVGEQVRVNVRLISAASNAQLWSESYDRKLNDLLRLETDIAGVVADTLQAKLGNKDARVAAAAESENPQAHQLYLKGRYFWNKTTPDNLKRAIDYFTQAIAADPNYARAYVGLADAYASLPFFTGAPPQECAPKARAAAQKAVELNSGLAEAHIALANVTRTYDFDYAHAGDEFRRGLELDPNYAVGHWHYSWYLAALGRFDEAFTEIQRAIALDPLSLNINTDLGCFYLVAGRYQEAIEQLRRTLEIEPNYFYAHGNMGETLACMGDFSGAIAEYKKLRSVTDDPFAYVLLIHAYAHSGDRAQATRLFGELKEIAKHRYVESYGFAIGSLALGNRDEALGWLQKAYDERAGWDLGLIRYDPLLADLRGDPRFESLADKIVPNQQLGSSDAEKSIAVLPFADQTPAHDQEYFCDGISEEVLAALAKVDGLRVVARTSSFAFKGKAVTAAEIGRQLNVAHLLEGSVRREGDRVRITAQLVDTRSGVYFWSDNYERELHDVFAVQDDITRAIVEALKIKLAAAPAPAPTHNPEAFDSYLRGLYFSNKSSEEDLHKALNYFQAALDKDPTFAPAWSGIAKTWSWLADQYVKPLEAYALAKAASLKAIALNERDAEAHAYLGEAERVLDWNYAADESELRRALQIDPNSASAHMFLALLLAAKWSDAEALEQMQEARAADPLSPIVSTFSAQLYLITDRLDEAVAAGRRTAELDPNYNYFDDALAAAYRERGQLNESIALYEKLQSVTHTPHPGLAIAYARAGRVDDARRVLRELVDLSRTRYLAAEEIASVYVALGEFDEAFRWLERAIADHSSPLEGIGRRRAFRPLYADPRFPQLLRRIGLEPRQ